LQLRAIAIALVIATGCGPHDDNHSQADASSDSSTCTAGVLGSASAPIQLDVTTPGTTADVVLHDGDSIGIALPPQGGRVVFIGVRATNLDACGVQLSGAIRDVTTQQVRVDARTVNLIPGSDGWGTSAIQGVSPTSQLASYANIPVCPNEWASTDIFDHAFALEVTLTDRTGRKATKTVQVVPKCIDDIQYSRCQCICRKGYVLGDPCLDDAGSDAPSDAGGD
jgi:hypothetical protein